MESLTTQQADGNDLSKQSNQVSAIYGQIEIERSPHFFRQPLGWST